MRFLKSLGLVLTAGAVLVLLGSLVLGMRHEPAASAPTAAAASAPRKRVRVEVLNAAGVPGLARSATERLRDRGFDVVYFGNAHAFGQDTSVVLDRVGDEGTARRVAEAMGIQRVVSREDSTLYVEATVVVGRDWARATVAADSLSD